MTALLLGGPLANACETCGSAIAIPCFTRHDMPCRPHVARRRAAPPEETARPGNVVVVLLYRDPVERLAVLVQIIAANLVVVRLWEDGRLGDARQMAGANVVRLAPPGPERDAVQFAMDLDAIRDRTARGMPPPPESLVGALQDRVAPASGRLIRATPVRAANRR